jgi:nucleotide-binding universal stress UspA family protein
VRREIILPTHSTNYLQRVYDELEAQVSRVLESKGQDLTIRAESRAHAKIIRNFSISTHIAIGNNAAKKIVEYARRHKVDLIVMSSRSTVPKNRIGGALKVL